MRRPEGGLPDLSIFPTTVARRTFRHPIDRPESHGVRDERHTALACMQPRHLGAGENGPAMGGHRRVPDTGGGATRLRARAFAARPGTTVGDNPRHARRPGPRSPAWFSSPGVNYADRGSEERDTGKVTRGRNAPRAPGPEASCRRRGEGSASMAGTVQIEAGTPRPIGAFTGKGGPRPAGTKRPGATQDHQPDEQAERDGPPAQRPGTAALLRSRRPRPCAGVRAPAPPHPRPSG